MKADMGSWVKQNLFLVLGVGGGLFLCCAIVLVVVFLRASTNNTSLISNDIKPSHYGVFVKQNGDLIELQEREIFSIPIEREMSNAQVISERQPVIVVWRADVNLDYIEFYKLNQYLGQTKNDVRYSVTPKEDGVFELTPASSLGDGIYCLIQGDPFAATLPGWCFRLGAISENQIPTVQAPIMNQPTATLVLGMDSARATLRAEFDLDQAIATLAVTAGISEEQALATYTAWEDCFLYEETNEPEKAIECYKNLTVTDPNNFEWWNDLARVYANNKYYLEAIDVRFQSLHLAQAPDEKIDTYVGIGTSYYRLGEYDLAIKYLQEGAVVDDSTDPYPFKVDNLRWLGMAYEANGQQEEACQTYKEAIELGKNFNNYEVDLITGYMVNCP